eukprot:INCI16422.14.p3 GENE.INCI16422.14~~INCI16422.14.p3  ORF type:complete len:256 (+),score=47.83 INCI16422.14:3121-3888(+)
MADTQHRAKKQGLSATNDTTPRDVENIQRIMESMGAETDSSRVISQLLEFVQRFSSEVLVKANALQQHRRLFGVSNGFKSSGMTSADITSALQIVERYKFQGTPSVEYLQANAQQHFLNLMGDGEEMAVRKKKKKKKKKKTVTELQKAHAAMKRDPFGDLRKCPSGLLIRPFKRNAAEMNGDTQDDQQPTRLAAGRPGVFPRRVPSFELPGTPEVLSRSISSSTPFSSGPVAFSIRQPAAKKVTPSPPVFESPKQ